MSTNVSEFIGELNQGKVEQQVSHMLSEVAAAVMENDGKGKIVITLDLKKISNSSQVNVSHTLKYSRPTKFGTKSEDLTNSTPMYVSSDGAMTFFPPKQGRFFDKQGQVDQVVPK